LKGRGGGDDIGKWYEGCEVDGCVLGEFQIWNKKAEARNRWNGPRARYQQQRLKETAIERNRVKVPYSVFFNVVVAREDDI